MKRGQYAAPVLLFALLCAVELPADEQAPRDPPASVWNSATLPPAMQVPAGPDSTPLDLRLYDFDDAPGDRRRADIDWATDVRAMTERCSDGTLLITGLVIGGRYMPLEQRCPEKRRAPEAPSPAEDAQPLADCDANRWTCYPRSQP